MDIFCVFFLLSSLTSSSKVSVVFDFNDLLNDVAPACSMMLSVDVNRDETNNLLMDVFCVTSFFCLYNPGGVQQVLCWISVLHSMILLLCLQSCCLLT